ncbi:MAG TPA: amino acid adenylation domain-containing protein, partial [Longimicrobiaceae bacterium]|nr:amino acid adenylation domain-containing protein [Longimicrobiaceae bacterium]
ELVERHETLRTTFAEREGEPVQVIHPPAPVPLPLVDLRGAPGGGSQARRLAAEEALRPFDLTLGPLLRSTLLRLGDEDHVLLFTMHHVVTDGWSMDVLVRELSALYAALGRGEAPRLPALPVQYADFAVWQRAWLRGEVLDEQIGFWKKELAGAPPLLEVPLDRPRRVGQSPREASRPVALPPEVSDGLRALARREGATLFMTTLAAWQTLLGRYAGQQDVVVGTPVAGRNRLETEGLIGFFVNMLALRAHLSGDPTWTELLGRVREAALGAYAHQDLPFERLVEELAVERSLTHSPVFQVTFALQRSGGEGPPTLGELELEPFGGGGGVARYDLGLVMTDEPAGLGATLSYRESLFEAATVARMADHLAILLEAMAAAPGRRLSGVPLLRGAERRQVVEEWNRTVAAYPGEGCIHERFEQQVERTPEVVAVVSGEESLSYGELNARANRLAHRLRELGVGPDARVGICAERGLEMIVGLLAVLKAGGAYVPLDPAYPAERLRFVLRDSAPVALLTQARLAGTLDALLEGLELPRIDLDPAAADRASLPATNPAPAGVGLRPEHLAYVIYTSGSTGRPKGVMVPHRNVVRLFSATGAWFGFGEDDVWTLFHSFAFDFSVWEIWGALMHGGRLVVVAQETARSAEAFYGLLCRAGVTVLNQTPSAFRGLMAAQGASTERHRLRWVVFGGEALETATLRAWFERNGEEGTRLVNMYGITETTVHVTYRPLARADVERGGASPVGRRIPDLRTYVLDGAGEPVPVGVAGELYVGGGGLARGYLGRPELTAERFVPDPFSGEAGARLYRSGDRVRWVGEGEMEYLGRTDHQVKVRGFRIEPGEIEARLEEHPEVREAAVLAREDASGSEGRRLVAYYVGAESVGAEALRAHLSERLPEYMVPAAYVRMEALPLTANGKLDRRALPAPEGEAYATRGYEAPQGEVEEALAQVWAEVLGLERVGRRDHFFELGGHSLLVVRAIERMRQRGLHADVRALFTTPTLAELAAAVGGASREVEVPANGIPTPCEAITPQMLPLVALTQAQVDRIVAGVPGGAGNVQDVYPLAPLQEGIFFHHLMSVEGDPYLTTSLLGFDSRPLLDAFLPALQAVIGRHDILRTAVVWEDLPEPVQVVWREAPLPVEEVELDPSGGDAMAQLRERFDPRHHRIDLRQAPLLRGYVAYDRPQDRWLLLLLLHHLADDNTSLMLVVEEVRAHLLGEAERLPPALPFRNFVAQARLGVSREEHEAFFTRLLGDVEEPTAPFGLLDVHGDTGGIAEASREVEAGLGARLREAGRRLGVSAASVCHVAWAQVLARVSGRDDVVFGTVLFGRMQGGEGADRVIGPFINTLPVRLRVEQEGAEAAVRGMHALLAELLRHEHASLALVQRCSGVRAPTPLFSALLNYRHGTAEKSEDTAREELEGIQALHGEERTNYPLVLSVDDLGDRFRLTAQAPASVGPERVCALVHTALERLVEALGSAPERPLGSVDVLPEAERRQVLEAWNRTEAEYPAERCVHELFEAQAARTPDAVALSYADGSLTYGELDRRANRLAHHLRGLGVGPDQRVALCLERGPEMMSTLLGILKAGAAYVPLDPAYPPQRLAYMLEDSGAPVLLTQRGLAERLPPGGVRVVRLDADADAAQVARESPEPPQVPLGPDNLAYVIYTSGSTGRPKGVAMPHR